MGSWLSKKLGKKEQPQLENKRNEGSVRSRRRSEKTDDEYTLEVIVENVEKVRERSRSGSIKPEDFDQYLQRLASCSQDVNKLKTKKSETKEKAQKLIRSVTNELIKQKLKADLDLEHSDSSTSPKEETRIKISNTNTISFEELKDQLEALKKNITEAEVNKNKNSIRSLSEWIETFRDIIKTQELSENQRQYLENELQRLYQKIQAMNQRWKAESGVPHSPGSRSQSKGGKNSIEGSNINDQNERRDLRTKGQDMTFDNKFKPVDTYYTTSTGSKANNQNVYYSHQQPLKPAAEHKKRYAPYSSPDGKIAAKSRDINEIQVAQMPPFPNYEKNVNVASIQRQNVEAQRSWPEQTNYSRELDPTSEQNPPISQISSSRSINSKPAEFYHADHLRDDKKHPDVGTRIEDKKRLQERPLNKANIPETFAYGQPKKNAQVQGRQDPLYIDEQEKKPLKRELQNFDRKKDEEKGNRTNSDNRVKRMKNDEGDHEIALSPNTKEKKHFYNLDDQYSFPDKSVPFGEWVNSRFDEYVQNLEHDKMNENDKEKHVDIQYELKQKDIKKVFDKHKLPKVSSPRQTNNNNILQQHYRRENEDQHFEETVASEVENSVYSNQNEDRSETTAELEENHDYGLLEVQRIQEIKASLNPDRNDEENAKLFVSEQTYQPSYKKNQNHHFQSLDVENLFSVQDENYSDTSVEHEKDFTQRQTAQQTKVVGDDMDVKDNKQRSEIFVSGRTDKNVAYQSVYAERQNQFYYQQYATSNTVTFAHSNKNCSETAVEKHHDVQKQFAVQEANDVAISMGEEEKQERQSAYSEQNFEESEDNDKGIKSLLEEIEDDEREETEEKTQAERNETPKESDFYEESPTSRQQNKRSVDQSVDEEPQEEQPSKIVKVYQDLGNRTSQEIAKRDLEGQLKRPNDQIVSKKPQKTEDEPLKILDVHQYFRNDLDFKSLESLNFMDRINTISDHAHTFESQINSFDGEKCSLAFFVLDEKLMRLIENLDKIKSYEDAEATERKVQVIEYIKRLHEILDQRASDD